MPDCINRWRSHPRKPRSAQYISTNLSRSVRASVEFNRSIHPAHCSSLRISTSNRTLRLHAMQFINPRVQSTRDVNYNDIHCVHWTQTEGAQHLCAGGMPNEHHTERIVRKSAHIVTLTYSKSNQHQMRVYVSPSTRQCFDILQTFLQSRTHTCVWIHKTHTHTTLSLSVPFAHGH